MSRPTNIYVMKCREFYKIGVSNSVNKRHYNLSSSLPFEIEILANYKPNIIGLDKYDRGRAVRKIEKALHTHFSAKRVRGEWFLLSPDDLNKIPEIIENGLSFEKKTREVSIKVDFRK